ncbi:amidohydrolase [Flavonifractor plautii]|jgi:aminobenzoyl-glutamate utilization protein A|uniref:amidohydrolase n=1 Tax=Flavonifractor plautii TaxID=292800 RepID=UPI00232D2D28|nr:amidohydrolase [Flavonifractor plautii]MDB7955073.1 amidohydrolase [Flavonifractor plautii]
MNQLTEYRREFHKYPENGWREFRTSARVAEILTGMGYDVAMGPDVIEPGSVGEPERLSEEQIRQEMERAVRQGADPAFVERTQGWPGVMAVLDTGREGPVSAMRFEMDCLPYDEPQRPGYRPCDEGYLSCNPQSVHACGHDGHTAIGLGIAAELMKRKGELKGKIKLFFQPAEETFYGAQSIVDKGHLDDVMNFIAVHIALSAENKPLPSHTIACGCRDFLSDRQLDVYLEGKAAHPCGASQEGKNALLAACSAALNIHSIAPHEEGLCRVNVGEIHAGVCANTIAPNAMMRIEYRGQKPAISEYAGQRIFDILEGTAKAYDLKYHYVDYGEVPAGASDYAMMEVVQRAAKKVPWFQTVYFEGNVGGTDDAAVMLTKVQQNGGIGSYVGIGADTTGPVHNPEFDFDEDCLQAAVDVCVYALEELHGTGV